MCRFKNILGHEFNYLVVVKYVGSNNHGEALWLCRCKCGKEIITRGCRLRSGHTRSCGCYNPKWKHGGSRTRLYEIWHGMKGRCLNPNKFEFKYYGGKGIRICNDWKEFIPFRDWALANGYTDELTIDRIDSHGNYEPSNCRWATTETQNRNKSGAKLTFDSAVEIVISYMCGEPKQVITQRFGVSCSHLEEIVRGKRWMGAIDAAINTLPD